jgi:hypothetical protein
MAAKFTVAVVCALFLSACASPKDPEISGGGIETFQKVDQQALDIRGQWLFYPRLRGLASSEHFVLEGLFLSEQGKVGLYSHFNGFRWRDGVWIGFRRDGAHLNLQLGVPGYAVRESELPAEFLRPDGRFKVRIEVHNGGVEGVRVLVWKYDVSRQGEVEAPRPFISESNADYDSLIEGRVFAQHGRGVRWGLEFEGVRPLQVYREAPYVP